jgi:hypothetical protein
MHGFLPRLIACFSVASATFCASAAPMITFGGSADGTGAERSSVAGVTTIDFNGYTGGIHALPGTLGGAHYTATAGGGGNIVTGSLPGLAAAPSLTNTSAYLAVPSTSQPDAWGTVAIDFAGSEFNYFGMFWGSIDAYNTISFYDGSTLLWAGSGASIADPANGCQTCPGTNRFVNFSFGEDRFDKIVLSSSGRAFETDNHAFGTVPEPGVLALLGIGLIGFAAGRRR